MPILTGRISPAEREEILADEFTRPKEPGIRELSVGMVRLCRKLKLAMFTQSDDAISPDDREREMIALAYMLDEKHPLATVAAAADLGPAFLVSAALSEYEFALEPAFLLRVQRVIDKANAALEAAGFRVAPKPLPPGATKEPAPPGES